MQFLCDGRYLDEQLLCGLWIDTAADYITGAQRILKAEGYYGSSVDGLWGSLSEGATKNFQAAHGLASDGIIGTNTWYQLRVQLVLCGLVGSYYYDRTATEGCYGSSGSMTTEPPFRGISRSSMGRGPQHSE
jgi:peptidoglycan hydrolase-like protein with peptidoglycan-binding domain